MTWASCLVRYWPKGRQLLELKVWLFHKWKVGPGIYLVCRVHPQLNSESEAEKFRAVSTMVHLVVTKRSNKYMLQMAVFVWWDMEGSLSSVEWNMDKGSVLVISCILLMRMKQLTLLLGSLSHHLLFSNMWSAIGKWLLLLPFPVGYLWGLNSGLQRGMGMFQSWKLFFKKKHLKQRDFRHCLSGLNCHVISYTLSLLPCVLREPVWAGQ